MKRRTVLLGMGALTSLGFTGLGRRRPPDSLEVRIWLTEGAADSPGVASLAAGYVGSALEAAGVAVNLTFGGAPVSPSSEDDRHVRRVAWPRTIVEGAVGNGEVDPVRDVNLLITDGDVTGRSAGYAVNNIAAIAGARHLAEMAPADRTPPVVDYTVAAAITQLLLHECGHALGLGHDHGGVDIEGATATVSPMVSGYAWAPESVRRRQLDVESNACSEPMRPVTDQRRLLSMRFSDCAAGAIRRYRGGLLPDVLGATRR